MSRHSINLTPRKCPSCGDGSHDVKYHSAGYEIVCCNSCDFVYLPVSAALEHYVEGDGAWENSQRANTELRLKKMPLRTRLSLATRFRTKFRKKSPVDYLDRHFYSADQKRIEVLDIGCGNGGYLLSLEERFVPFGIEISKDLARQAENLFSARGGSVINAPTTQAISEFAPHSMDAIVMRSYLEHEADPLEVLQGCAKIIRKGGLVVIKVPNYACVNRMMMGANWCGFRFPDHVNYFTPQSLSKMASLAGFKTVQRFTDKLPTSDNMWAVLSPV